MDLNHSSFRVFWKRLHCREMFICVHKFPCLDGTGSALWPWWSQALRNNHVKIFVKHLVVFIQNTELKMPKTDHTICVNICHTVFLWWLKIFLFLCGCEIIHSFHWALYELRFFPCKVRKTTKKTLLCKVSRGYTTNERDLKTSLCQKKKDKYNWTSGGKMPTS